MDTPPPEQAQPTFYYSIRTEAAGWTVLAPLVTTFCFYAILFESVGIPVDLVLLLVGLIPELELLRHWGWSIWTARFYDDHAEIRARKIVKSFAYSDVLKVVQRRSGSGATLLSISLRGERKPIGLHANPVNKRLRMNLKDWLRMKAQLNLVETTD